MASRGFGLKLSEPFVTRTDRRDLTAGIAVASPETDKVYYIRVRPVPRLEDQSWIVIQPRTIDPKTTKTLRLTVKPRIRRTAAASVKLDIDAIVESDSRLQRLNSGSGSGSDSGKQSFEPRSNTAPDLVFTFNLNTSQSILTPLDFRVKLQYSLPQCTSTYTRLCPMFEGTLVRHRDKSQSRSSPGPP